MASDKKIVATEGREIIAGTRYAEIRDIISNNSDAKFKDIIGEIAGISSGSYYNYTSENSPKYGRISLFTAKNLSEFFNLPIGIFDCSEEFSEDVKTKMAEIISNKYSLKKVAKNSSDIIEMELLKKLEYASKMEDKTQKDVMQKALESYFIRPFRNKNHLINYFYLIEKYKENINKSNKKININERKQKEAKNKAFMYCLAYDDLIMQYIRDGEIINFKNDMEFKWPNELEYHSNGITYPHFMEVVLSLYGNYNYSFNDYDCLDELSTFYDMLEIEESDVISISKHIFRGMNEIRDIEWYKQLLEISEEEILEKPIQKFTIDDFIQSSIFSEYNTEPKKMLYLFFEKIKSEGLEIHIQLRMNNVFTIYANENVGNRLAVVSVYEDSIKVSKMYDFSDWHRETVEEIDSALIKEIVEKYNNQPKRKNMKFDNNQNCFY